MSLHRQDYPINGQETNEKDFWSSLYKIILPLLQLAQLGMVDRVAKTPILPPFSLGTLTYP